MVIRSSRAIFLAAAFLLTFSSAAVAQTSDARVTSDLYARATQRNAAWAGFSKTAAAEAGSRPDGVQQLTLWRAPQARRPSLLVPLYASAIALEGMDVFTTYNGLSQNARETNALVRGGNAGTTIALKAATMGLGILFAEKIWKKNRAAAIATMVATNAIGMMVVANNYNVINQQKR